MKKILSILILISTSIALAAQTSGYLGKRNFVKLETMLSPGVNNPGFNKEAGLSNINKDISIGFGRATSRRSMLEFAVGVGRTSFYMDAYTVQDGNTIRFYNSYDEDIPETKCVFYKYDLKFTKYFNTNGNIAPLGNYHSYVLSIIDNYVGEKSKEEEIYFFSKNMPVIVSGFIGNRNIYRDFLMVDISAGFGLTLNPKRYVNTDISNDNGNLEMDSEAIKRVGNLYFFQFRIGIGLVY